MNNEFQNRAESNFILKSLILAQNERWRRGLGMQVVGESPSGRVNRQKGEYKLVNVPIGPG